MAAARGASDPAGQMILCTGAGTVVVYMDETGAPTQAPHFCPECTLLALDDGDVEPLAELVRRIRSVYFAQTFSEPLGIVDTIPYLSRAPPYLL